MWVQSLGQEDPLETETATHSSVLVWKTHGQRSLEGYSPWDHKVMTEYTHTHLSFFLMKMLLLYQSTCTIFLDLGVIFPRFLTEFKIVVFEH